MSEPNEQIKSPERTLNIALITTLKGLDNVVAKRGKSPFEFRNGVAILKSGDKQLATITSTDILVGGLSLGDRLPLDGSTGDFNPERFESFMQTVQDKLIRLNHLGVSYLCSDLETETQILKTGLSRSGIKLYQEPSPDHSQRWLFAGDRTNWQSPLFELVLNQGDPEQTDFWAPHFQIDLDTALPIEELKQITDQALGQDFLKWQLDIPDYGTVLAMGVLGSIGKTKIALGLGTNLRGTEFHRKNELQELSF